MSGSGTLHGGVLSVGISALTHSFFSLSFLSHTNANPILNHIRSSKTPINIAPSISELSSQEHRQLTDLSALSTDTLPYTESQLRCSEKLGLDPSECTASGKRIVHKALLNKRNSSQKPDETHPTPAQEQCAKTLDVSPSECNKYGVFTNRTHEIKKIIQSELSVKSMENVTLEMLEGIAAMYLESKNISSLYPHDLQGLTALRHLSFLNNRLTTLPKGLLKDCTDLYELVLSDNSLIELDSDLLKNQPNLSGLFLSDNQLTSLPPHLLNNTIQLKVLDMDFNHVSEIAEDFFAQTPHIRNLYFMSNNLTNLPDSLFDNLAYILSLYLTGNPLSLTPPLFHSLQKSKNKACLEYKYIGQKETISFALENRTIPLSEIKFLFKTDILGHTSCLYPKSVVVPSFNRILTQDQREFLCTYLHDSLIKKGSATAQKWLESCNGTLPFFNLTIPLYNLIEAENITTSHHNNMKMSAKVGIGLGILGAFIILFSLAIYQMYRHSSFKNTATSNIEMTPLLSAQKTSKGNLGLNGSYQKI